ncbi:transmembrane protein 8B [Elysia marginata]|uniref:Transmembrane protein 8B n=1 Tax=Elysia marginata TaxID=1093978 RepID=A0AAV4ISP4_9GAST|nr:transmembrane protein 8B [Elysia marginata]
MQLKQITWILAVLASSINAWPQPSESINWDLRRSLVEYKMYAAVNLGRIDVPLHTLAVNISVAVERNDNSCPVKDVIVFASTDGIPVVSRDGEAFPNNTFTNASTVYNITVLSNNETASWVLEGVTPGSLFLMAVMPNPDSRIKQKGLGKSCRYYLTTRAKVIFFKEKDIEPLHMGHKDLFITHSNQQQIFSFQVPVDSLFYEVEIKGCNSMNDSCPVKIFVLESLGPLLHDSKSGQCVMVNRSCSVKMMAPIVQSASYLVVSAEKDVNISLNVHIKSSECVKRLRPNMTEPLSENFQTELDAGESLCSFAGQLGRETPSGAAEGSSFFDHFVAWDEHTSPHTIISEKVSDVDFIVQRFNLRTADTGSSLRLDVQVPSLEDLDRKGGENNSSNVRVDLCLIPRRLVSPKSCGEGKLIQVALEKGKPNKHHIIVPYPPGGVWYISLQSACYEQDKKSSERIPKPCTKPVVTNVTVHLSPCVDGGCGEYGSCNLYLGAGLLYSACDCFSGWRGYGCNDGSQAESATIEKLAVYLLTLSNLAFLPGICLAVYRRFYTEALVYAYNMFFSTFYHACDTSRIYQLCILEYNTLSFADFFASLMSFWVTLMAMARLPAYPRALLHVCGAVLIALGEVHNRHGLIEQMLPLALGIAVMFLSWGIEIYKRKRLFPSRARLLKFVLPGVALAVLGLVLNLALETKENYKYVHSSWHVLEATAICFLLPPHTSSLARRKTGALSIQSGDISQHPLVGTSGDEDPVLSHITLQRADQAERGGDGSLPGSSPESTGGISQNGFRLHNRTNRRQNRNFIL